MTDRTTTTTSPRRDSARRRSTLLAAAIDVMAAQGYSGASLREVAAASGMEKGHLTYYFPTKDDLLYEIVDDLHQRFIDARTDWDPGPDHPAIERLRALCAGHTTLTCQLYRESRVAYENMRFLSTERRRAVRAKRDDYQRVLADLIEAARSSAPVADVATGLLANVVLSIINWPYQWYDPDGPQSPAELGAVLGDRAIASILR